MSEREKDNDEVLLDGLKGTLYQYKTLYDRLEGDRDFLGTQCHNIKALAKLFTEKVEQFSKLEQLVKQRLVASIQETAKESVKQIHNATREEMSEAISPTLQRFEKTVLTASERLQQYEKKSIKETILSYDVAILVGISCGVLVAQFMMPAPIYPIDDERLHYIFAGEKLNQIWPKLSKTEQKKITALFDAQSKKDHEMY